LTTAIEVVRFRNSNIKGNIMQNKITTKEKVKVTVYFSPAQHKRFKAACNATDSTMAAKLVSMSKSYSDKTEKAGLI
jgi:hypothetical protein